MANVVFNSTMAPEPWGEPTPASVLPRNATGEQGVATRPKVIGWVKMAPDILRAMSMAAQHAGRSSGDVWAEAAREWLLRRSLDADYDALSNAPQRKRGELHEMRTRLWHAVDSMMEDLREVRPTL